MLLSAYKTHKIKPLYMKKRNYLSILFVAIMIFGCTNRSSKDYTKKIDDNTRAEQIKEMKFGMFICWSFSTFYGKEWTPTLDKDATYFKATGCDTDQWCKVAKDAGMGYILFLAKHHDGFCLWDTKTTDKKVNNSPLEIDVIKKLRKSCDKYGIKLALYFSEGDWNWPGAEDGGWKKGGSNPEMKKAQLKELCTQYGPIEFFWMDHAVGEGGLSHKETVEYIHQFQPNCFIGFNTGETAGRLNLRERGRPGPIGDKNAVWGEDHLKDSYDNFLVAEFTYPILPKHEGGADWFYSLPKHDNLCKSADDIYKDYVGAVKYGNIFSIDVGPNYEGKIRDIDVKTLQKVGKYIRGEKKLPAAALNEKD
jgi:alpha-L-fucosidase